MPSSWLSTKCGKSCLAGRWSGRNLLIVLLGIFNVIDGSPGRAPFASSGLIETTDGMLKRNDRQDDLKGILGLEQVGDLKGVGGSDAESSGSGEEQCDILHLHQRPAHARA